MDTLIQLNLYSPNQTDFIYMDDDGMYYTKRHDKDERITLTHDDTPPLVYVVASGG